MTIIKTTNVNNCVTVTSQKYLVSACSAIQDLSRTYIAVQFGKKKSLESNFRNQFLVGKTDCQVKFIYTLLR